MSLNITITETGIDQTIKDWTALARRLGDHRDFLRSEVVPELRKEFSKVFTSRGYGTWKPLAQSTIKEKQSKGYPPDPLIRTGYYKRTSERLRGMSIRRNVLEIRSPVRYAAYHEYGTRRIPQRSVFCSVAQRIEPRLAELYRNYNNRNPIR